MFRVGYDHFPSSHWKQTWCEQTRYIDESITHSSDGFKCFQSDGSHNTCLIDSHRTMRSSTRMQSNLNKKMRTVFLSFVTFIIRGKQSSRYLACIYALCVDREPGHKLSTGLECTFCGCIFL